jgi:hypothetical protein
MEPSTSTDTTTNPRTFGTLRKKPLLRKNVVVMVCVFGMVTYSLVPNSYSGMLAYVPERQFVFADDSVANNVSDEIQTKSLSPNKDNDNKPLLAMFTSTPTLNEPTADYSTAKTIVFVPSATEQGEEQKHTLIEVEKTVASQFQGGIFLCGYANYELAQELFPDYASRYKGGLDSQTHQSLGFIHPSRPPTADDILLFGMHGPCQGNVTHFPGKVLFTEGEPNGRTNMPKSVTLSGRQRGEDVYQIGMLADSGHSVLLFHGAWSMMQLDESIWPTLWDHSRKPINSGKYKGLMYMNGNCKQHREQAVNRISAIMPVYHGGRCKGNGAMDPFNPSFQKMPNVPQVRHWINNRDAYSEYKFCIAMENSLKQHYLSEKIIMAFLAGCIPIYYGSNEVFDIFNKDAFIFYDPRDPVPALKKLQMLISNETAYQEMLHQQPILANGEKTVHDYFSVSDRIGSGYLKNKLRRTMGLPV